MKNYGSGVVAVIVVMGMFIAATGPAEATPAYGKAERKPCSFCHIGKTGDRVFTDAGTYYRAHHSLAGFGEGSKASKAPAKPVPEPDATRGEEAEPATADAESPCPYWREGCPGDCPHRHGAKGMHPMWEKMKAHREEMKNAVSDLRESERKMESAEGPEAFRAAVLEHLKILDGIQESHLDHMETMMGAGNDGKPARPMHSR